MRLMAALFIGEMIKNIIFIRKYIYKNTLEWQGSLKLDMNDISHNPNLWGFQPVWCIM